MDISPDRSIEINKGGLLTVRMNEAATPFGYAWLVPSHEFECVTMLNDNYGDFITGYKQWVFQANDVSQTCAETIPVQRSQNYEDCPGCTDVFEILVTPIQVADATATVTEIFDEGDSDAVKAAKTICNEDDQTFWSTAEEDCVTKCDQSRRRNYFNPDTNRCERPKVNNIEKIFEKAETKATLDLFSNFGRGGFTASMNTINAASTAATPTSTVTVSSDTQCPSGQYYSFLQKKCVVDNAPTVAVTTTIVVKTEAEKVAEKATEAASHFAKIFGNASDDGGDSTVDLDTPITAEEEAAQIIKVPTFSFTTSSGPAVNPFAAFAGGNMNSIFNLFGR